MPSAENDPCQDCADHHIDCAHCEVCGAKVRYGSRCHAHPFSVLPPANGDTQDGAQ